MKSLPENKSNIIIGILLFIMLLTLMGQCSNMRSNNSLIKRLDSMNVEIISYNKNLNEINNLTKRSIIDYRVYSEKYSLENLILEDDLDKRNTTQSDIIIRIKELDNKRDSIIKSIIK